MDVTDIVDTLLGEASKRKRNPENWDDGIGDIGKFVRDSIPVKIEGIRNFSDAMAYHSGKIILLNNPTRLYYFTKFETIDYYGIVIKGFGPESLGICINADVKMHLFERFKDGSRGTPFNYEGRITGLRPTFRAPTQTHEAKPKNPDDYDDIVGHIGKFIENSTPIRLNGHGDGYGGTHCCDALAYPSGKLVLLNDYRHKTFKFQGFEVTTWYGHGSARSGQNKYVGSAKNLHKYVGHSIRAYVAEIEGGKRGEGFFYTGRVVGPFRT